MSTKIKAGTATTGAVVDADATGILELQTGSTPTTAVTIDSSGNVGIGTASPAVKLVIEGGTSADQFRMGTGANYYKIGRESVSTGYLNFYGTQSGANGYVFGGIDGERMRIDSSGNLLVGLSSNQFDANTAIGLVFTPAVNYGISIKALNTASGTAVNFRNPANGQVGSIQTTNTSTAFVTSSDYRLKENIAPMVGALDKVSALKPVTYDWKDGGSSQGFIAHELQSVVPEAVVGEKDAVNEDGSIKAQGIDTSFLVATLVAAIQELKAEVDALKGAK